ncbi:PREDICTED: olfactory receptor 5F1-like [Gekko japonicus]|uniref:Olfactory receptor n=1 Tax=Gekko japonicus TaxID=146911 RepID=A0ABM1K3E3_GEKJA|nr:PREDICTED: olfactory receptor 5F1-like [Gekko japonicus]
MGSDNLTATADFILVGLTNDRKTQILLFGIILILYTFILVGNLWVIMLAQVDSHLHTPMYFFLTHLSSLDICYATSTIPQMLAHLLMGRGRLSLIQCALQMYTALALGSAEALLLGVMAYDRYLAICHPLTYAASMGRWHQVQLASACWGGGFCVSVVCISLTFSHPYCDPCCINHFICEIPMVLKLACDDIHTTKAIIFLISGMIILVTFSVIMISYGLILFSVFQMHSASGLRKAFSTCGSHLSVVILFYGTTTLNYILPPSGRSPDSDKQIAVLYVVVTPLLNPIIYTLRNKDVFAAMAKVLRKIGLCLKTLKASIGPKGHQLEL